MPARPTPHLPPRAADPEGRALATALFLVLVAAAIHGALASFQLPRVAAGALPDTDSYTHLLRVAAMREGAIGWRLQHLPQFNAPEGIAQHWTLPFDLLILLPALAAEALGAAPRQAMLWSGALLCPVLHLLAALAAAWAARALWPAPADALAGVLVLLGVPMLEFGILGRTDHHVLLTLWSALAIGAVLRALARPEGRGWAATAGAALGLGLWTNPEAMLTAAPLLAALGAAWALTGEGRFARLGLRAALGALGPVLLGVVLERPPALWLRAEYDRVSVAHLALLALAALVFLAAAQAGPRFRTGARRLAFGAGLGAAALSALRLAFPGLIGVSGGFDAGSAAWFVPWIHEMRPVALQGPAAPRDVAIHLGAALLGLVALAAAAPARIRGGGGAALLVPGACLLAALAATLVHVRAGADLAAPAAIAAAGLPGLLAGAVARFGPLARLPAAATGMALLLAPSAAILVPEPRRFDSGAQCRPDGLGTWLAAARPGIAPDGTAPVILPGLFGMAPQLAWETPYRFVAAPYHRGGTAFADTVAVLRAQNDAAARAVLARRGVRLVLLCRDRDDPPDGAATEGTLGARLRAGVVPDWLAPVPLPAGLDGRFLLFEVR